MFTVLDLIQAAIGAIDTDHALAGRKLPLKPIVVGGVFLLGFTVYIYYSRRRAKIAEAAAKRHEVDETTAPATRFIDVAGCVEAVEELREVVDFLQRPDRFEKLGAKMPRGALLVGPPGTGKTLLARAVAGEAGVPFFHHAGSDFVELYVGAGAKRIRELYAKANDAKKAIVFIDEIDAIGKKRSSGSVYTGSNDEQEHTLIALLNELDGFSASGIFTIAATNRPDVLDPALTRPGRLERKIAVPTPDRRGRQLILRVHVKGKPLARDVDLDAVARRTPGMSGADLAALVNEAALEAVRRRLDRIDGSCFERAVGNISMGRARYSAEVSEYDRTVTAWHEAGHTILARLVPEAANPAAVSIIPRGQAGGVTWMEGEENSFMTKAAAKARLIVAFGGRAAEERLLGGDCTHGAQADLSMATEIASSMVRQFGMTERGLSTRQTGVLSSYDMESDDAVEALLAEALHVARSILAQHHQKLEALAAELLTRGTLYAPDLDEFFGVKRPASPVPVHTPASQPMVNRETRIPVREPVLRRLWGRRRKRTV
jgi:cell division protease FtsH